MPRDEVFELKAYIDNDYDLHRQQYTPQVENLKKKIGKGVYDPKKAEVLLKYLADSGAKKYNKSYGGGVIFTPDDRRAVAKLLRKDFEEWMKNDGYMTKTGKPTQKATLEALTKVQRTKFLKARKVTQKRLDSSASYDSNRNSPRRVSERGYSVN